MLTILVLKGKMMKVTKVDYSNRARLIQEYIDQIIDGMDLEDLIDMSKCYLGDDIRLWSNSKLEKQIQKYYPELLEE